MYFKEDKRGSEKRGISEWKGVFTSDDQCSPSDLCRMTLCLGVCGARCSVTGLACQCCAGRVPCEAVMTLEEKGYVYYIYRYETWSLTQLAIGITCARLVQVCTSQGI